jgi:hypothetical protein
MPDSQTTPSDATPTPQAEDTTSQPAPAPGVTGLTSPIPGLYAIPDTVTPEHVDAITRDTPNHPSRLYVVRRTENVQIITNGPVPDTPENRALYRPLSRAGRRAAVNGH